MLRIVNDILSALDNDNIPVLLLDLSATIDHQILSHLNSVFGIQSTASNGFSPLSDIIANHSVNHQLFADDTQLKKSAPLSEVTNLTKELSACTDDIKSWMTENQLKLNDDKTEALLFPFSSSLKPSTVPLPDSITLGSHNIPISDSVSNLGFLLDSKLSVNKQ